ncbi:MAG: hypothetical protein GWO11_04650 [Desulfuromonadales bacterium]|nr:hypothetical protein [Desulfuromonadales bacterium]NIR33704.1 hypothetical protein [Desulfuromonadales bacterium]NIS44026.1 hypothetical protein [Desulfuromonadales bacterium]
MSTACSVCGGDIATVAGSDDPAEEAGRFLARELWDDEDHLCSRCLANRGMLGMMYCREFD